MFNLMVHKTTNGLDKTQDESSTTITVSRNPFLTTFRYKIIRVVWVSNFELTSGHSEFALYAKEFKDIFVSLHTTRPKSILSFADSDQSK